MRGLLGGLGGVAILLDPVGGIWGDVEFVGLVSGSLPINTPSDELRVTSMELFDLFISPTLTIKVSSVVGVTGSISARLEGPGRSRAGALWFVAARRFLFFALLSGL